MASASTPVASEQTAAKAMLPSREEVINCAISSWYKDFKSITFKSVFISLCQEFIDYLNSDGCTLPQGCSLPSVATDDRDSDIESEDEQVNWDVDSSDGADPPSFPELLQEVTESIDRLGGAVLPKLNWSSPRDATWMVASNNLRCTCPAEVILLLKSSNFIAHDLSRVFEYCPATPSREIESISFQLCLRKWENFHPSAEFRCFVYSSHLIGISQRNHTACYRHLLEIRNNLKTEIMSFFLEEVSGRFKNNNYVFDVARIKENRFWLVDFNPYCPMTDPLLYTWEELSQGPQGLIAPPQGLVTLSSPNDSTREQQVNLPELRLVDGHCIQPSHLRTCRLPQDIIDLTSGEDIHKFADFFMKGTTPPVQDTDSDSD